uniref:Reverse transcriptase domain-containing protein n=1 Tax=Tanacetum cinerariifolium TaxID=118510 RepID=A0A6L2JEK4_TANCI|nr:reverse transcriptase domain-containing protein [Tanacetum cinerariifolium]
MHTRSKFYPNNSTATISRRSNRRRFSNIVEPKIRTIEDIVPMADQTMKELLHAPTEGYGEAIAIPEILAKIFEIKTNLLQLVQTNKFHGFERDNPHTHISNFKRMTATLKYRDVSNDAIKLMLFSYSIEGATGIWYEKEPPNSILTWDDLEMLRACSHHGFSKLTQIDTFYNGLNEQDQDSLNAAAGGNLLSKTTRKALKIIENKSKVRYSRSKLNISRVDTNSRDNASKTDDRIDKLANQISNLVEIVNKQVITPVSAKAVEKTCVICGGAHAYYDCIATDSNQPSVCAATGSYNQVSPPNRASHQIPPPDFAPINVLRGDFNKQEENLRRNLNNDMRSILGSFFQNQSSTSGILSSNTVPNPKVVEQDTEETTEKEHSNCPGSNAQIQPPVVPISIPKPDVPWTQPKPTIPYPSRLNDQNLREKATNQMERFFQIFHDLHFDVSFADALLLMPKFDSTIKSLLKNNDKLFELEKVPLNENCSSMLLKKLLENLGDPGKFLIPCDFPGMEVCDALADLGASINLMPLSIWKKLSLLELTPTQMTLELADRSITHPKGVAEDVFVKVGKFHFPTDFVVVDFEADPRVPLILGRSFLRTGRALIDVYGEEITFRYNPKSSNPTLVFDPLISESDFKEIEDFLKDDSIPMKFDNSLYDLAGNILFLEKLLNEDPFQLPPMDLKLAKETKAKSFFKEPPELELKELPSHLEYAFLEDSNKLPVIIAKDLKDVEKEALIKDLKSHKWAIAWKISDIKGIDSRFCTHKILMEEDYKPTVQSQRRVNPKIHDVIKKEVIKLLDAGNFQIPIDPQDQEKTTFTCPYGTFAYRRMPFGLCNAPGTFQREGIVLGHKILKSGIEVDRAKVDVIAKLPHPTNVKGVRSFLGHETPFVFSKVDAFNTLKKKLTEAPILVVPGWNLPFELMCDASDFTIGAVLGKCKTKHFQPIQYASKTITEAQIHYTTTEKEMLAVLFTSSKLVMRDLLGAIMVPISQRRRAIISYRETHFCNDQFTRVMIKYRATHHLATAYHPQTSGQMEAYENSVIYKERTKKLHDSKIKNRIFNVGDQVLLFNSRLKIFSGKLKTRWYGPFTITQVFLYGTVELSQPNGLNFKVNGHRVK